MGKVPYFFSARCHPLVQQILIELSTFFVFPGDPLLFQIRFASILRILFTPTFIFPPLNSLIEQLLALPFFPLIVCQFVFRPGLLLGWQPRCFFVEVLPFFSLALEN